jgi:hypothetical protein
VGGRHRPETAPRRAVLHSRRGEVAMPAIAAISPSESPRCAWNLWASAPASSPRSLNTMVQGTPEKRSAGMVEFKI